MEKELLSSSTIEPINTNINLNIDELIKNHKKDIEYYECYSNY